MESLTLVNLLCKKLPAETQLSNALHECVSAVRTKLNVDAEVLDFDWTQVRSPRSHTRGHMNRASVCY